MRLLPTLITAKASIERLIYLTGFAKEESGESTPLQGNVTLHVDRLTFGYKGSGKPVLHEFSMTAKPGTMVALTGRTGAGKTTFLRLLLGLVKPNRYYVTDETLSMDVSERPAPISSTFHKVVRSLAARYAACSGINADDTMQKQVLTIAAADFVLICRTGWTLLGESGGDFQKAGATIAMPCAAALRESAAA